MVTMSSIRLLESFGTLPKSKEVADIVEGVSSHTAESLSSVPVANPADVPERVETPSEIRAIAANLDLQELANILLSLVFFSEPDIFKADRKLNGGAPLLAIRHRIDPFFEG